MPAIAFDRFYRYAELTAILQAFAVEHPRLVSIESIGKSHEGRDIWVLTVTTQMSRASKLLPMASIETRCGNSRTNACSNSVSSA